MEHIKTTEELDSAIASNRTVLLDFYADWCQPCRLMTPALEKLQKEFTGKIVFAKVDIEEAAEVTTAYKISSIPTLIVFRDGQPVERVTGLKSESDLRRILSAQVSGD